MLTALLLWSSSAFLCAAPAGMTVQQGRATATTSGNNLTLHVSDRALLHWQSFNIGASESVTFVQPSAASIAWNRILDANPSAIYGRLEANGIVVLQNSSGFYFGPNAFVATAGLLVTTSPSLPPDFAAGGTWVFNGPPPAARIENYGELRTHSGGSLFLIAQNIENHGTLAAPEGQVGLLAGQQVLLSERPDGRGLSAQVRLPSGVIDNSGRITASAGEIALHAQVVNQGGIIEANTVRERHGVIELIASDAVNLTADSRVEARGADEASGRGGEIVIKSGGAFTDATGSILDVRGGGQGGDGGFVEVSATQMPAIRSTIRGTAQRGWRGGSLLIDPLNIVIGTDSDGTTDGGVVHPDDPPDTLRLDVNSSFIGFSQITLDARQDINLVAGTQWNLNDSTGLSDPGSLLTLRAGRNVTLENGSSILAGANWSIDLAAGVDFGNGGTLRSGIGNISMQSGAGIQSSDGSISLRAGRDVTVQTGFVRTVGGGDISVTALAGTVNTGSKVDGFQFTSTGRGYDANLANLGGISTGAGGDVEIVAGLDIISLLPSGTSGSHTDGGSGAFGSQPGNVTLSAGRDVTGHYVVRNGEGKITAGRDAGTLTRQLALSLVSGSWDVSAAGNILLQEVRNPNGIFNNRGISTSPVRHLFDYAPDASVRLAAGNSVQLLGAALPRNPSEAIPPIYAPSLEIEAGAGGVILGNNVYLFPSAVGQLEITTTDGGSVHTSQAGRVYDLVMSDSPRERWSAPGNFTSVDSQHSLIHQNDLKPAKIDVSGNIKDLLISLPKPAEIDVAGDLINTSVLLQNFRSSDVSRLNVAGDIVNRNNFTFAILGAPPNFNGLANAVVPSGSQVNLALLIAKFFFTESTGRLAFQGRMTGAELAFLQNLQVKVLDAQGRPILDADGNFVTEPGSFVPGTVLNDVFTRSQDVPNLAAKGYQIGGPGRFEISARNMDLGITEGIVSHGPGVNPLLGPLSPNGADIVVSLLGSLSMFSSSIQSRAGGDITVVANGAIDVGSQEILASSEVARGIYTAREGDVTVIAREDIRVNGSRIAAYSGGDVLVRSLEGDVDAGEGGVGFARVERVEVDSSGAVTIRKRGIPGSGILATTFPNTVGNVGDITVETPQGDILAGAGGIAQVSFNGTPNKDGVVSLVAGTTGEAGNVVHVGSINAGRSGVIGGNIKLRATGDIEGVVIAQSDIDISSGQSVNVTALAGGNVSVNAAGAISGTIVGVGSVDAQGGSIDASLVSQNVSASGATVAPAADAGVATSASQAAAATAKKGSDGDGSADDEEKKKKKGGLPTLARSVSRVTVILPNR